MKILVTGASGMLGCDICALFSKHHDVTGIDKDVLDITSPGGTLNYVKSLKPAMIINCAAFTNVDGCETQKDEAYLVNALGARNLAIAANEINAPLVHYSTDYVFDGTSAVPYTEFDNVNPIGVYGKSKLAGEEYLKNFTNRFFIIRTQWLFGKNGPNFVKTILKRAAETGLLRVVNDQTGRPTYTKDLAVSTLSLIDNGGFGTYHITNAGTVSWYEFTQQILKAANQTSVSLTPCTTDEFPRPAKRPAYSPLDNYCIRLAGLPELRHFDGALNDYLNDLNYI